MKQNTCCFTGHRTRDLPKDIMLLRQKLYRAIENLISQGVTNFIAGGALGFDTLAELAVIDLRQKGAKIGLTLFLPCRYQETFWNQAEKENYHFITSQADEVVYISEYYFRGCMHKRNRAMVDSSGYCIAYLDKQEGGTFYTVNYAKAKGLIITNLAER